MGDYPIPPGDSLEPLVRQLKDLQRQLNDLQRPSGTNIAELKRQVEQALVDITATVISTTNTYLSAGTVTMSRILVTLGITSPGVYSTDVTALPGARTSVWVHNTGVFGQTISSKRFKTHIEDATYTAEQILSIAPRMFQYQAQAEIRDDPANAYYDPNYVVPTELGMIAEELVDAGLGLLVFYENDGVTPRGIHYELFGAIAALVIGRAHEERITELEKRIESLKA